MLIVSPRLIDFYFFKVVVSRSARWQEVAHCSPFPLLLLHDICAVPRTDKIVKKSVFLSPTTLVQCAAKLLLDRRECFAISWGVSANNQEHNIYESSVANIWCPLISMRVYSQYEMPSD